MSERLTPEQIVDALFWCEYPGAVADAIEAIRGIRSGMQAACMPAPEAARRARAEWLTGVLAEREEAARAEAKESAAAKCDEVAAECEEAIAGYRLGDGAEMLVGILNVLARTCRDCAAAIRERGEK